MILQTDFEDFYDKQLIRMGSDELCFVREKTQLDAMTMLKQLASSRPTVVPFSTVEQVLWAVGHIMKDKKMETKIAVYQGNFIDSITVIQAKDVPRDNSWQDKPAFLCGNNFETSTKTISYYIGTRTVSYCVAADKKPKLSQNCAASVFNRMEYPLYSIHSFMDHGQILPYFMEVNPSLELLAKEKRIKPSDVAGWLIQYFKKKGDAIDG